MVDIETSCTQGVHNSHQLATSAQTTYQLQHLDSWPGTLKTMVSPKCQWQSCIFHELCEISSFYVHTYGKSKQLKRMLCSYVWKLTQTYNLQLSDYCFQYLLRKGTGRASRLISMRTAWTLRTFVTRHTDTGRTPVSWQVPRMAPDTILEKAHYITM